MTETTTPLRALDIEQQASDEMRLARRRGHESDSERARAKQAFVKAEQARDAAIDAQTRGEAGADELLAAALDAAHEAAQCVVIAEANSASARRVYEEAEARRRGVRTGCIDELATDAEVLVQVAISARDALRAPLDDYVAAYRAAEARWRELGEGSYAKAEADDAAVGTYSDADKLRRAALAPEMPITQGVIDKLMTTTPRPPVFAPADEPMPIGVDVSGEPLPEPLFDTPEGRAKGYERFTKGERDAQTAEPLGWRRFRDADALSRGMKNR